MKSRQLELPSAVCDIFIAIASREVIIVAVIAFRNFSLFSLTADEVDPIMSICDLSLACKKLQFAPLIDAAAKSSSRLSRFLIL